jgi:hypothetical protein
MTGWAKSAVFCTDGILKIRMRNAMMPAYHLLDQRDGGLPWWLSNMPVEIEPETSLRAVISCLLPWSFRLSEEMSISLETWLETHYPIIDDTPKLRLVFQRTFEIGGQVQWEPEILGIQDHYGAPHEIPPDVLGQAWVEIAKTMTLVDNGQHERTLDAGHSKAMVLSPHWMGGKIGIQVPGQAPTFSDFVFSALIPIIQIEKVDKFTNIKKTKDLYQIFK